MAGKHTFSPTVHEHNPRTARAYCEGMAYRQGGTLVTAPAEDNPYAAPYLEEVTAWLAGWTFADAASPGAMPASNCALVSLVVADA